MEECKEQFSSEIADLVSLPMHTSELDDTLKEIIQVVLNKFGKETKMDSEVVQDYAEELKTFFDEKKTHFEEMNELECKKYAGDMLN